MLDLSPKCLYAAPVQTHTLCLYYASTERKAETGSGAYGKTKDGFPAGVKAICPDTC